MLEDFEKSVKATLYDRLASPLIGSYITAWCVVNYRMILIIFSSMPYPQKVQHIDALFVPWWRYLISYGVPALVSALYIFVYPHIAKWVFKKWQQYIKDKRDIKNKIEEQALLTQEESAKIREDFLRRKIELNSLLADKDRVISELNDEIKLLHKKLEEQQKTNTDKRLDDLENALTWKEPSVTLSEKAALLLRKIVDSGSESISIVHTNLRDLLIAGDLQISLDHDSHKYLNELTNNGFITQIDNNHYMLHQSGRDYITYVNPVYKI